MSEKNLNYKNTLKKEKKKVMLELNNTFNSFHEEPHLCKHIKIKY